MSCYATDVTISPGSDYSVNLRYAGHGYINSGGGPGGRGPVDSWFQAGYDVGGTWRAMGYGIVLGYGDYGPMYNYPVTTLFLRVA